MRAGELKERVIILEKTAVRDAMGGETITYTTWRTVYAKVTQLNLREYFAARQGGVQIDLLVEIRRISGIVAWWRVQWQGEQYDIVDIPLPSPRKTNVVLKCRGPAGPT